MIGVPRDFQHVSHVNQEEALNSKVCSILYYFRALILRSTDRPSHAQEMAEVADVLRQSSGTELPSSATMIISMPSIAERKEDTSTPRPSQDQQPTRQSLDLPDRKPTVNKRKAPPPITQSIIKAAGLPPSLATSAPPLPLSPASPSTKNVVQALRGGTPVKLKVKRQSKSPVPADLLEDSAAADNDEAAPPGQNGIDGLEGLPALGGIDDLDSPVLATSLSPSNASGSQSHSGPVRSTTLQNSALSESMKDVYKQAIETSDLDDSEPHDLTAPPREPVDPMKPSPSGPLAYMTDSTKIRWDNGMAEIARQLKEQD